MDGQGFRGGPRCRRRRRRRRRRPGPPALGRTRRPDPVYSPPSSDESGCGRPRFAPARRSRGADPETHGARSAGLRVPRRRCRRRGSEGVFGSRSLSASGVRARGPMGRPTVALPSRAPKYQGSVSRQSGLSDSQRWRAPSTGLVGPVIRPFWRKTITRSAHVTFL